MSKKPTVTDLGNYANEIIEALHQGRSVKIQTVCENGFVKEKIMTPMDLMLASRENYGSGDDGYISDKGYEKLKADNKQYCSTVGIEVIGNTIPSIDSSTFTVYADEEKQIDRSTKEKDACTS